MLDAAGLLERVTRRSSRAAVGAAVHGLAAITPEKSLSSGELAARLGIEEEWILSRTGVRSRPVAHAEQRLDEMATRVALDALRQAGVAAAELDLVVVATITADEVSPNCASLVAHALGAARAGAVDLNAACTGFLSGLALGAAQIESGRAGWVLVVGADFITRITDWGDQRTAPLFGDGAGAAVLGPASAGRGCIGPIELGSDGSGAAAIQIGHADRVIRMDGPEVYKHAVARMVEASRGVLDRAGLSVEEIDLFVPHQANARITRAVAQRLDVEMDRVVDVIACHGNASAATLPLGLAAAADDGRLRPGAKVLLAAFGAGFTWGAGLLEWGGGG